MFCSRFLKSIWMQMDGLSTYVCIISYLICQANLIYAYISSRKVGEMYVCRHIVIDICKFCKFCLVAFLCWPMPMPMGI
ncbi:hypothetical protein DFH27DRAFT_561929 [Peziza echinospora]|nr:hypothetical protein DFH27DRAFT_561929 [Peziza echinospora]